MRRITTLLLAMACPVWMAAQQVLYVTSGNGNLSDLYTVNPLTAQATFVGEVMIDGTTPVTITALEFHPGTGVLYGVTGSEYSPSRVLVTINPQTAVATTVGVIGAGKLENANDLAFASDGTLYGWNVKGGPLLLLDSTNASRQTIGSADNGNAGNGLAFVPNGTLYLVGPTTPGDLFTVNTATGAITSVAALSNVPVNFGSATALASDENGVLFVTGKGSSHLLATINPTTGVMTSIGNLGFEADALAFTAVPEPSVWVLLTLGLAGALAGRRRRAA